MSVIYSLKAELWIVLQCKTSSYYEISWLYANEIYLIYDFFCVHEKNDFVETSKNFARDMKIIC